ncbi:putative permease [Lederbergia galactosidilyticus]|uniref:AEC family transporter n=1 Tax=Lederbergia galactosidilytica TaxID=217031 RepID=UPI001D8622CA|nr:AEC family transporter [Lederbergia galactosidilytica]MBP1914468.1 putative permease [Lederbergia galactosidilytica]
MANFMESFLQEMMILYGIAILGFLTRKKEILNKHATTVLTQLILYITLPSLILFSLNLTFSFSMIKQFIWLISMSFIAMILAMLLSAWMRKQAKLPEQQKKVYESLILFGNQGFIGYAVIYALFHEQGIIYLTIFNIFYLILIWTYGIYLFTKDAKKIDWNKIFLNPGILSTILGLFLLFSPLHLPEKLATNIESIGKMTIPLSMLVIGCLIADAQSNNLFSMLKNQYIWKSAIAKLIIIPLLLLPFYFTAPPFPLLATAVIVSGMPSASTISLYAQKYGADSHFASIGILVTTLLSVLTVPLLYIIMVALYK